MAKQWDKELDYSKIEFSFALATQVRLASIPNDGMQYLMNSLYDFLVPQKWPHGRIYPLDEIRDKYDHVFETSGAIVEDLESLLYEINQEEVEPFNANENKITRHFPLYNDELNKGEILIELSMALQIFTDPSDHHHPNQQPKHLWCLYPLTFLGHYS